MKNFRQSLYLVTIALIFSSCAYQNIFESNNQNNITDLLTINSNYQYKITVDDKLSISVWNHDNMSIGSLFGIYNSNEVYGKWVMVDASGYIMVPKIGRVRLLGLTCVEAADTLAALYSKILVDPNLVVKVLNRDVTILGEVRTPGNYILEKQRNTITEIIGIAQGFEFYADKKKVQLIRNNKSYQIDFTKLIDNNYQILVQAGDVINIPTRTGKSIDKKAPTLIPFASALTALALIFSVVLN
jgi:polysaccharide export outer membrane protein|tara:strand:- start:908 stop:1636 length:729 start_codon:yes stop_codon:yes gene_type:complete